LNKPNSYPTSDQGRVFGAICILIGVVVIAMPIAVVGDHYTEEYKRMKEQVAAHIEEERREHELEMRQHALEYARSHPELLKGAAGGAGADGATKRRWAQALSAASAASAVAAETSRTPSSNSLVADPHAAAAAPDAAKLGARLASVEEKLEAALAALGRIERAMGGGGGREGAEAAAGAL